MTDDTQTVQASSTAPKANAQDPLSVLEDILNEAKERTTGGNIAQQQAAEEAAKRAEIELQAAEKQAQDAIALKEEIAKMQQIIDTPQEQARLEQEQQADSDESAAKQSHQTNQIRQIGHTKI